MARRISFTKAERAAVDAALNRAKLWVDPHEVQWKAGLASLLHKMDEAAAPAPPTAADFRAVGARRFVELAQQILADRVFLPPFPAPAFWSQLQSLLTKQGISERAAEIALDHVATWARHPQDITALARNASRYLHEAALPRATRGAPQEEPDATLGRPPELR